MDSGVDKPTTVADSGGADVAIGPDLAAAPDLPTAIDLATAPDGPSLLDVPTAMDLASALDLPTGADADAADANAVSDAEAASDAGGPIAYGATLGGNQETPVVSTTAKGTASLTLDATGTTLTYHVTHNVAGGTASHIHIGNAGEAGAVLFPLTPFSSDMSGAITVTAAQVTDLEAGRYYVNVHSTLNPGGEIRGQILHPGELLYVATLTGAQEAPPVVSTGTGTASAIVSAGQDNVKYHLKTSLTPTNAHIHTAIGGISGAVTIPFSPIAQVIDGQAALTAAQATDMAEGRMYVNVHTAANPGGEIRGQLLLPGETLATATMTGSNEVPPVATTATGAAAFILSYAQDSLRYQAVFTGLSAGNATAAHIHTGIAGVSGAVLYPLTLTGGGTGATGTQAILPADLAALMATPPALYANVHTVANPGGEIRGQILPQ